METLTDQDAHAFGEALQLARFIFTPEGAARFASWYSQHHRDVKRDHGVTLNARSDWQEPANRIVLGEYVAANIHRERAGFPEDPNVRPAQRWVRRDPHAPSS